MSNINAIEMVYRNKLADREQNIRQAEGAVVTGLVKIGFELKK